MIEAETETAKIPIKKTAHVVLTMGSTSIIATRALFLAGYTQGQKPTTSRLRQRQTLCLRLRQSPRRKRLLL